MHAGAGFEVVSGSGIPVDGGLFSGHWTDTDANFGLRIRVDLADMLDFGLGLGAGFELTALSGSVRLPQAQADTLRLNPTAVGWGEIGYRIGQDVRLGLRLGFAHSYRTQTYLVRGAAVLELDPTVIDGALTVELGIW